MSDSEKPGNCEATPTSSSSSTSPKKKLKRLVKFNDNWKKFDWIRKGRDDYSATCAICNSFSFSISHGGENDVRRHMLSKKHILNSNSGSQSQKISNFFVTPNTKTEQQVAIAETAFCYHSCIHSHSYISSGCGGSLFSNLFGDSAIAQKYSCGRTKTNAIVTNVLGPFSKNMVKKSLMKSQYFSIMTDASNKGNIKCFPLLVKFFDKEKGVKYFIALVLFTRTGKCNSNSRIIEKKFE